MNRQRYISSFSVIVTFIALSLLGCVVLPLLPVKLAPSQTLPGITVSFSMADASARTIESEVTSRLESLLARVSGVKHIQSKSSNGSGSVTLEFERGTDMAIARFETSNAVRQAWSSMPDGASYPFISMRRVDSKASRPFMSYTVNAGLAPAEIMRYAEENIKPALSRIDGVASVDLSGAQPMEWQIRYDTRQMSALGISPQDVRSAITAHLGSEFLGMAETAGSSHDGWMRLAIKGTDDSGSLDISKIVVCNRDGHIITLDKIATAVHAEAAPTGYFRINGLNSIYLNITATDEANQIDLSRKVKETLASVPVPGGYMLNLSYDASESISTELDKIYFRTGLTILILLVFVGLITLSWRYLCLITISLAINLAIAVVAYYLLDVEIQLYSLAGITISLNLIIDNLIVMTEALTRRNRPAAPSFSALMSMFTPILAATLTTAGALSLVFFLDEQTMLSLKDFVIVVMVNLGVSLAVALFLVPALAERIGMYRPRRRHSTGRFAMRRRRLSRAVTRGITLFVTRHRAIVITVMILAFGMPVFMLPEKLDDSTPGSGIYNATLGSTFYRDSMKPWVDRCLGSTLRLFVEKVYNGSYWGRGHEEPTLYVNATLPNGATLGQMNRLIRDMEAYIARADGVRQFQSSVYSPRRASIVVYFKPKHRYDGYPYQLKADIISKALTLGGGSWSVYGLEDQGFNNDVRETAGSYRVMLQGYNYDELYNRAEVLRDTLQTHRRIREVIINSEFSFFKDDYTEFYLDIDKSRLAGDSLSVEDLFAALNRESGHGGIAGRIAGPAGAENIRIAPAAGNSDVWSFINGPINAGRRTVRISDYATMQKRQAPPDIAKYDQQYTLCLQYEYIGSATQGKKVLERTLERFNRTLPMGYSARMMEYNYYGNRDEGGKYLMLGLIAVIIFFISAILFNSLRQPLAIIMVIPVSFIGVFLTFYLFKLKFDQGGFAAMILLCGITINAAIYIINGYNSLMARRAYSPQTPYVVRLALYLRAFRAKITAVLLTVLSTVLGFIPFLIGDTQEGFWFPLAAGTMGGLVMSLAAIYLLLPVLVLPRRRRGLSGGYNGPKPDSHRSGVSDKSCPPRD